MTRAYDNATAHNIKGFKKILTVNIGTGTDMHGQDPTVGCSSHASSSCLGCTLMDLHNGLHSSKAAALRAVSNACEASSVPPILDIPGGAKNAKVKIKVAVPNPKGVDKEKIAKSFPYGKVEVKVVGGGLRWHSGIIATGLGDPSPKEKMEAESSDDEDATVTSNDELMVAVAAVRVGY